MARRPTLKVSVGLESLESREVLSAGGPTAEVQELLELTNFARTNPVQAANWAVSDLQTDNLALTLKTFGLSPDQGRRDIAARPATQPLSWSPQLSEAAGVMSRAQAERGVQTHDGGGKLADGTPVGTTLSDRLNNAHYDQAISEGENAFAYATSVRNATKAFLLDWGNDRGVLPHLSNITNAKNREAGFAVVDTKAKGLGPKVVTEVFGTRAGAKPMLVGVAFNDTVKADHFYQAGEGQEDVTINVTSDSGQTQSAQTWKSGGYQIPLSNGHYTVTAKVGDRVVRSQDINVSDQNVKVDFVLTDPWVPIAPPAVVTPPAATPPPVVIPPAVVEAPKAAPAPVTVVTPVTVATPVVSVAKAKPAVVAAAPQVVAAPVAPLVKTQAPQVTSVAAGQLAAGSAITDPLNQELLMWESW